MSQDSAEHFEAFWSASEFSPYNIQAFAASQDLYNSREKPESILEYPDKPLKLPTPKSRANTLAKKRFSSRKFSNESLSQRELGILLSSFRAHNGLEHRSYASAGASYGLEIFCLTNHVQGFERQLLYYNPDLHALSFVSKAPTWTETNKNINVSTEGEPQLVLFFVSFSHRLTEKYLERGGRFALLEVGAAMQQLSLQIAGSKKLQGVAAGGLIDNYWLEKLGLSDSNAKIALGYLCGK